VTPHEYVAEAPSSAHRTTRQPQETTMYIGLGTLLLIIILIIIFA
jgi:hypothetical protein